MVCNKCFLDKSPHEMVYNATHGYYASTCKACKIEYLKDYRRRNKQYLSAKAKDKYAANPEPKRTLAKRWARENKDRHNANTKAWRRANPEKQSQSVHNWDAAKRGASGSHTADEWKALKARFDHRCANCREKRELHRDHVLAPALGGTNNIDNIQPLCKPCNSRKGQKTTDYR